MLLVITMFVYSGFTAVTEKLDEIIKRLPPPRQPRTHSRRIVKVPKPRNSTRPPRASASVIWSIIVATIRSSAMRSDLVNTGSVLTVACGKQHPPS